jgi:hypothetical protein
VRRPPVPIAPPREWDEPAFGVAVGLHAHVLDEADYDLQVPGDAPDTEITASRKVISLSVRKGGFTGRLGLATAGEWDASRLDLGSSGSQQIDVDDGSGLRLSLEYRHRVWDNARVSVSAFGDVSYLREEYALSYNVIRTENVLVGTTNGTPVIETRYTFDDEKQDVELTEALAWLGGIVAVEAGAWTGYARLGVLALHDSSFDGTIEAASGDLELDIERKNLFLAAVGATLKAGRLESSAEFRFAAETAVHLGVGYRF